jgi:hypothetical protein
MIGAQQNVSSGFEITPSTAVGGTTFCTPAVTVLATGNVGINDTSPGTKLVISNQAAINTTTPGTGLYNLHFTGLSTNDYAQGITFNGGSTGAHAGLYVQGSGAYGTKMYFATTDSYAVGSKNRMIIDYTGYVGIGNIAPATPLDVTGGAAGTAGWNRTATLTATYPLLIFNSNGTKWSGIGYDHSAAMRFWVNAGSNDISATTAVVSILNGGNVGIGTTTPGYTLDVTGTANVNGAFTAVTKSFKIKHQREEGKSLIYGVLEGPEHAVYARGKLTNSNTIILPNEWEWLVDMDSVTVQLTPIGSHQKLYIKNIENLTITVGNENLLSSNVNCYYIVHAARKDVDPLQTVV